MMAPEEIVAAWDAGLKSLKAIHHQAGNDLVRVSVVRAKAFCFAIATHHQPTKSNANTRTFAGSDDFQLRKGGPRWKIVKLEFTLKCLEGNPDPERTWRRRATRGSVRDENEVAGRVLEGQTVGVSLTLPIHSLRSSRVAAFVTTGVGGSEPPSSLK